MHHTIVELQERITTDGEPNSIRRYRNNVRLDLSGWWEGVWTTVENLHTFVNGDSQHNLDLQIQFPS